MEKLNLELLNRSKRLSADAEGQARTVTDLRQRLAGAQEALGEERGARERERAELELLRADLKRAEGDKEGIVSSGR